MPQFQYTAVDPAGQRVAGVVAGASEQAVLLELESRRLVPVSIAPRRERTVGLRRGVSIRHLAASYQQLSDLLRAGVPLLRALRLLGARRARPRLALVFKELAEGVAEGEELAGMMARRPDVFPKVHVAMVRAGEKGGFLEVVMARLGQFVAAQAELRAKVIGNLAYPVMLVVIGTVVLGVIFGFFVPKFRPIFAEMPSLPLATRLVFGVADAVGAYGVYTLGVIVVAGIGVWRLGRLARVRRAITEARTRSPVLGPLIRSLAAARFCRLLGTMLANGIPLLTAMQIARDAAGNVLMEEAIDRATEAVRAGQPLAPPLGESGLFGDDVVEMISVAEAANNLDEVLVTIAETVERQVDRLLGVVIRMVEPILLLAIAGVVVVVAAGLILPMTQLRAGM